ncbi:uroporphyrinogen-III C-methyltransferase [Oscillatoria sp. FACHB-1406]|uniref:uroporphyrinogen-III C-methyltransferase n=1 Tax=Oscillatoria sp. FACHB-1406 TaxID=2692846 RepID=UPI001686245C|nr:uroporphyrinogen-III C-methyltransferase [Oscillatoria sp. FACHB-1406]MBD2576208.1 uroporphyrinogen-III C-methyltransferase [Oscillatoria sp. FACHB-1406]
MNFNLGKVYLVGVGVGSWDYLTHRGEQLLRCADVAICDALINPELLQLLPPNCLYIDVGKRGGKPSMPQAEIDRLLVTYCQQGKQVVRLKSGDPLIFGRAREEVEALKMAGCPFEIVPGLSSALAAPLLAGIPLTDKHLSNTFAVVSAHQPDSLDWEALSRLDTLVFLMGGRNLAAIVEFLQQFGRNPSLPIAIIRNCGNPDRQIWQGTLDNILDRTSGVSLSPCVIIAGEVVNLRPLFQMSESFSVSPLPLSGKTVLVTRAAEQSSAFSQLLQAQGASVIEMPALEIVPPSSWVPLDGAIAYLPSFQWLILTSSNAVDYFFKRLVRSLPDVRSLASLKIAVVGKKTAAALEKQNLKPDFIPPDFVADSLVEHFPEPLKGQKILFPRVETGGRDVLVRELRERGATVVEVPAYQSACPDRVPPAVLAAFQRQAIDIVTFASSKTVQNFCHLLTRELSLSPQQYLENICIASIGPQTSKTCYELCDRVDVEAREYTLEGLTAAIVTWVEARKTVT